MDKWYAVKSLDERGSLYRRGYPSPPYRSKEMRTILSRTVLFNFWWKGGSTFHEIQKIFF